jgi:hypothetical protein
MDLPHDTPAGDGVASAFAVRRSVFAGEKRDITPVGDAAEPSHSSCGGEGGDSLRRFFQRGPGSKAGIPFVLGRKAASRGRDDSTEDLHERREPALILLPDAQGHNI